MGSSSDRSPFLSRKLSGSPTDPPTQNFCLCFWSKFRVPKVMWQSWHLYVPSAIFWIFWLKTCLLFFLFVQSTECKIIHRFLLHFYTVVMVSHLKNSDNKINDKNIHKNPILAGSNVKTKLPIKWLSHPSDLLSCFPSSWDASLPGVVMKMAVKGIYLIITTYIINQKINKIWKAWTDSWTNKLRTL